MWRWGDGNGLGKQDYSEAVCFSTFPHRLVRSSAIGNHPLAPARSPLMLRVNAASLVESARVGADSLRSNPLRTVLATTGVIIGVASLVAAFAITDGVEVWSRELIARESSVQDVTITARTREQVRGRSMPVRGYPVLTIEDAARAGAEVPGVTRYALMLNGRGEAEYLDARTTVMLTLSTASLAEFSGLELAAGRFFTPMEETH